MAHLDENLIVAFFSRDGRSPEIVAEVDAHAAACEACRRLLAEFAELSVDESRVATEPMAVHAAQQPPPNDMADFVQRLALAQATKRIGTVVKDKWEIESLLGTGGMAHVFAARHRNGRRVAMKFMRPELALERTIVERFLREGYVANKIDHPGAVAILDDDVADDGAPFLVMELLVGETLRQRMAKGPMALDEALDITAEVLEVLAFAHDKEIVHRDLKPDNLFRTSEGTIKILDFGIARLKERSGPAIETRSGITMGTVGYMPPEQARGLSAEIDARSDLWAVGATLYSLSSGRQLHEAATTNEALLLAMTEPVAPMRELLPSAPAAVQSVIDRALAFEKANRYSSARAMKAALENARRGASEPVAVAAVATAATPASPPSSRAAIAIAGAIALAALGGVAGWRVLAKQEPAHATGLVPGSASIREPPPLPATPEPAIGSSMETPVAMPPSASAVQPSTRPSSRPGTRPAPRPTRAVVPSSAAPAPEPTPPPTAPPETRDPLGPRR